MSLSMKRNSDGSITIECGGDSLTIGAQGTPDVPQPKKEASADIPVLWPNGGATASIVNTGKAKTKIVVVPSSEGLLKAIREQHDLNAERPEPTIFQFHVKGDEPLTVEKINRALADLGDPEWMGTQIKLTGFGDE